jgi:hypothetical protein
MSIAWMNGLYFGPTHSKQLIQNRFLKKITYDIHFKVCDDRRGDPLVALSA